VNKPTTYQLGPDVAEDKELYDSRGRLIDDAYVDAAVKDAIAQVRSRGRPSLSASGESPLLRVRLSVRPTRPAAPGRSTTRDSAHQSSPRPLGGCATVASARCPSRCADRTLDKPDRPSVRGHFASQPAATASRSSVDRG